MASIRKRTVRDGYRYDVFYRDPDHQQTSKTFTKKADADAFANTVEADKLRGAYIAPNAGKKTFESYAKAWLEVQTFDGVTRDAVGLRFKKHVYPVFGQRELRNIRPSTIQALLRGLEALAPNYRRLIYTNVSTVLSAAVDDELIAKNPCRAASVRRPRVETKRVVPWEAERVFAVRAALADRYRIVVTIAAGLGLRQGEVFGLSPDDVDFLRGQVEVRRQVKLLANGHQLFGLPKFRRSRTVPLPNSVRDDLAAYLARWPARAVTLSWDKPDGDSLTVPLIVTTRESTALHRDYFNTHLWKPALKTAGVESARENGCHALRHFYASMLLDGGESIKAVSEYLGHSDPGFTLRVYTHLMASSAGRTQRAVDRVFGVEAEEGASEETGQSGRPQ